MATRHVAPRPAAAKKANAQRKAPSAPNQGAASAPSLPADWARPVISWVRPQVDGGRRPAKAAIGDTVKVQTEAFAEGHDVLTCDLLVRAAGASGWSATPMSPRGNDLWEGEFLVTTMGLAQFAVTAKVDRFLTWRRDLRARMEAGQDVSQELLVGAALIDAAATRGSPEEQRRLSSVAADLWTAHGLEGAVSKDVSHWIPGATLEQIVFSEELGELMNRLCDPAHALTSDALPVVVDRERARFSSWYEMFPRSASADPSRHGTFADVRAKLPYVAHMGFDVLYLPPIHPIGHSGRKGRDGGDPSLARRSR